MKETNYLTFLKNFFLNYKISLRLAIIDNNLKYRRTLLGPLWNTLAQLITIILLSIVWSKIFKIELAEYLPRLLIGMSVFNLILSYTTLSTGIIYGQYSGLLKNLNTNISLIYGRYILTSFINYLHFLPIFVLIFLIFPWSLSFKFFLFIPGLVLIILNGIWISLIISTLCTRFRDMTPLIEAIMSAFGLITPILWDKKILGDAQNIIYINPFTSMVEAVRDPILNYDINYFIYLYLFILLIIGHLICYFFYNKKRKVFTFWI